MHEEYRQLRHRNARPAHDMTLAAMTNPHILRLRTSPADRPTSHRIARRRSRLPFVRNFFDGIIRKKHRALCLAAIGAALLLGSCTYGDFGNIDNPVVRRAQWFSYLRGEDIQAACVEGSADRYRLIYNADFRSQVRAYEVTADGSGGAFYTARAVRNGAALSNFTFLTTSGWWRWDRSEAVMSAEMFEDLRLRLAEDGYFDRSGASVRLSSFEYYWLVTACVDGTFESGAWANLQTPLLKLRFPEPLFLLDETGLPVAAPRYVGPGERNGMRSHLGDDARVGPFWVTVDRVIPAE
jgi:hypothetical protein